MTENFTGIVLRTLKYSDNLMIADIFTETRGRLSFLVPVSRSKSSKVKSVLFQPLSMLSFNAPYRQGGKLVRLSEVRPYVMYSSIPYAPCKSSWPSFSHVPCAKRATMLQSSLFLNIRFAGSTRRPMAMPISIFFSSCV